MKIRNVHGNTLDLLGRKIVGGHYPAGSSMPPWKHQLTEPQRQQLVDYVRSLFPASEQGGAERRAAAERRSP